MIEFLKRIKIWLQQTFQVSQLGANLYSRFVIIYLGLLLPFKEKLELSLEGSYSVSLRINNICYPIQLNGCAGIIVLREIFARKDYDWDLPLKPKIILDLGSHIGLSVIYFKSRYPDSLIYACEAAPFIYRQLKQNITNLPGVIPLHRAITNMNGTANFYAHPKSSIASSLMPNASSEIIPVVCSTLDSLMDELKIDTIDLLKFDIEGSEYEVFKNFKNLGKVKQIIGELHLDFIPEGLDSFEAILHDFNIQIVSIPRTTQYILYGINKTHLKSQK